MLLCLVDSLFLSTMNKIVIIVVSSICLFSCCGENMQQSYKQPGAIVNDDTIFLNEVDSLIDGILFDLRVNALNQIVNNQLLEGDLNKKGKTKAELFDSIEKRVGDEDSNMYLKYYLDSLRIVNGVKILLMPSFLRSIETDDFIYNTIRAGGKFDVFIISDYKCPHCRSVKAQIDQIIKNNPTVNYHYIYHSDFIDSVALFAHACGLQDMYAECYNWLFDGRNAFLDIEGLKQFALEKGLDLGQLERDMNSNQLLLEYIKNRNILMNFDVNKVPSFIVNNKLLIDGDPINYLQKVIEDELQN